MKRSFPVILVALAATGCSGTDVGNPSVDVRAALVAVDFPEEGASEPGSARATIQQAWISVDRIRMRPASNCDGGAELELQGPFALDLFAEDQAEELRGLELSATDYCRFEFRWAPEDDPISGAPEELIGASLFLAGEKQDGTAFVVRSTRNDELRLRAVDNDFTIDQSTTHLFLTFTGTELFSNVSFAEAEVDDDGVVRIEPGSNEELLDAFEASLEDTVRLFEDADSDGRLSDSEANPENALAAPE